jgi:hypothetical protein
VTSVSAEVSGHLRFSNDTKGVLADLLHCHFQRHSQKGMALQSNPRQAGGERRELSNSNKHWEVA